MRHNLISFTPIFLVSLIFARRSSARNKILSGVTRDSGLQSLPWVLDWVLGSLGPWVLGSLGPCQWVLLQINRLSLQTAPGAVTVSAGTASDCLQLHCVHLSPVRTSPTPPLARLIGMVPVASLTASSCKGASNTGASGCMTTSSFNSFASGTALVVLVGCCCMSCFLAMAM